MISCKICGAKVPPEWKFAITNNTCPGCGKPLLDEESKELLDELRNAMAEMPNDPEGLAGWLLSNYKIVRTGDGQPVNFYGRQPTPQPHVHQQANYQHPQPDSHELPPGFKVRESPINKFLKNAGMQKFIGQQLPGKAPGGNDPRNLADIVNQIHNNIESEEAAIASDYYPDESYEDYGGDDFSSLDDAAIQAAMVPFAGSSDGGNGGAPMSNVAQALANNSSLGMEGGPPPTDAERSALIAALGGPSQPSGEKLHPALAQDRAARSAVSASVTSGVGRIKRSG